MNYDQEACTSVNPLSLKSFGGKSLREAYGVLVFNSVGFAVGVGCSCLSVYVLFHLGKLY